MEQKDKMKPSPCPYIKQQNENGDKASTDRSRMIKKTELGQDRF